ncbi:MAG TPA: hypothetical protein VFC85_06200 [Verrucomicrobiae bacterium]|nr:hypothetical protein [Verrucomicrobiae bacterium]
MRKKHPPMLMRSSNFNCVLLILFAGYFCVSCAVLNDNSNIADAEIREFHGDRNVFWTYANAGYKASERGDREMAKQLYLRAYRNTSLVLVDAPPPQKSQIRNMFFGAAANLTDVSDAHAYVLKLDELTPLPGQGQATNDVLNTAMNFQRSLAAYDWARDAGRLGDFTDAEKALVYSLHLEEIRNVPEKDKLLSSRHFELARLYHACGKTDLSIQHYRAALGLVKGLEKIDPIGFANVLDEFSEFLQDAGQNVEATQIKEQSTEIRKNNPGKKAKFSFEPYPKN